jgi:F0F1-type ATP synthase assembly protein I
LDLSHRRELNNGAGESMARAFELVLSPVIFAAMGWYLDKRLGTFPLVALVLFFLVLGYCVWRQVTSYNAEMSRQEAKFLPPKPDGPR